MHFNGREVYPEAGLPEGRIREAPAGGHAVYRTFLGLGQDARLLYPFFISLRQGYWFLHVKLQDSICKGTYGNQWQALMLNLRQRTAV